MLIRGDLYDFFAEITSGAMTNALVDSLIDRGAQLAPKRE
jgi:hypothetical protein